MKSSRCGGRAYSSRVGSGAVEPKKRVKALYDYWADLNFEIV